MYTQANPHGNTASLMTTFSSAPEPDGIEDVLLRLIQHHHKDFIKLRERAELAKKEAIKKAASAAALTVETVNDDMQEVFVNEKRIELEIRALMATITCFVKQTDQWLSLTNSFNTAIMEIGDFENWMKIMEFNCKSISVAIHNIHQP